MSYSVQINRKVRALTPEEGQRILKEMHDAVPIGMDTGTWQKLETKNNISKVDWPQWLVDWLFQGIQGLQYDTINWIFYRHCATRAEADTIQRWFENLKQWTQANSPEKYAVLEQVEVKIHDTEGVNIDVV